MFVLEVISGPYRGQAFQLVRGELVTIGRSEQCRIAFDDPQLSTNHAEFDWTENGFSVFDLGSSNGTYVNGQRIEGRVGMQVGDHLQIGQTILQLADVDLEMEEPDVMGAAAPARGQMLAFGAAKTEIAPRQRGLTIVNAPRVLSIQDRKTAVQQKVAEVHLDDAVLSAAAKLKEMVSQGGQGAKVIVQRDGRLDPFWALPVSLGREHSSGVVLDDDGVSLRHAVIDFRDGRYLLRDVGSSNGTFVNGKRVVEARLSDGDVISIGAFAMLVLVGRGCLGLNLQPPSMTEASSRTPSGHLGVIDQPLGRKMKSAEKRRKKKASEIVWYATSDLDRGVFRGRAAVMALALGVGFTGWMLATGDSETLAGNRLSNAHESERFLTMASDFTRDQCTACHVGAGRTSTILCLDCHPENRPTAGHVAADVECLGCHLEHKGTAFRPAIAAKLDCKRCHAHPHEKLVRTQPKLVVSFSLDAEADVAFHVRHQEEGVECLACHAEGAGSEARGIRGACGQCHAPDHPAATDCQLCHIGHPDRPATSTVVAAMPPMEAPPRFVSKSLLWMVALLVVSFLLAAVIPRKRKVSIKTSMDDIR